LFYVFFLLFILVFHLVYCIFATVIVCQYLCSLIAFDCREIKDLLTYLLTYASVLCQLFSAVSSSAQDLWRGVWSNTVTNIGHSIMARAGFNWWEAWGEIKIEGFGGRPPFGGRPGALGPMPPPPKSGPDYGSTSLAE